MRLVMHTIHLECPLLPGSLWQHISPEKPLGSKSVGTGPGMPLPFCAVLSPDDFREAEGGVQWMLQPFPPLSSELPIYFLWQFAQIVKIPCNYHCIWKPNMIYIWQAQSSLRWVGVCMCIYMCVYVSMLVMSFCGSRGAIRPMPLFHSVTFLYWVKKLEHISRTLGRESPYFEETLSAVGTMWYTGYWQTHRLSEIRAGL